MTGWQNNGMAKVAKWCQKLSKRAKSPKVGKHCQTLLEIVESCHNLPTGIKNGQKRQIWQQVVKCCQKFPTVGKSYQKLPKIDKKKANWHDAMMK